MSTSFANVAIEKEGSPIPAPISKIFLFSTQWVFDCKKSVKAMEAGHSFAQKGKGVAGCVSVPKNRTV